MRYVISCAEADENGQVHIRENAVVAESLEQARDHIVSEEIRNIDFDMASAADDDDVDAISDLQQRRRDAENISIAANGLQPVTISSVWAGPANDGGMDWVILPIAA